MSDESQTQQHAQVEYYLINVEDTLNALESSAEYGLSQKEAERRLSQDGPNKLQDTQNVGWAQVLFKQLFNAMVIILIMALAVSFAIKGYIEGGVITAVIVINVVVGFIQEYSAEKTMSALRSLSSPSAHVCRDGVDKTIPSGDLVVGDIVTLKMGDTVPADIRIIDCMNLAADEALLTGESLPVSKSAEANLQRDCPVGDRINMAFSSSTISKGRGAGVVTAIGMKTQIGLIAESLQGDDRKIRLVKRNSKGESHLHHYMAAASLTVYDAVCRFLGVSVGTPLQRKLSKLAILLFFIAVIFAIVVLGANKFDNSPEVIIYAVGTGLSMIPASLVVVLTITMAVGTKRMVKRNVIVRKLDSLEALGAVTDICSDKTGTLTQGRMAVRRVWIIGKGTYQVEETKEAFNPHIGGISFTASNPMDYSLSKEGGGPSYNEPDALLDDELENFLKIASMANLASIVLDNGIWQGRGDPTEIALHVFACRFNKDRKRYKEEGWEQAAEFPFDSDVKRMTVVFDDSKTSTRHVFTKGAVERVLELCTNCVNGEMDEGTRDKILRNMEALTKFGLRVLALAHKTVHPQESISENRADVEQGLTFVGLAGIYDPPRPESAGAVQKCHIAGINVHMLTGDHLGTAKAIAQEVGIIPKDLSRVAPDVVTSMITTAPVFDRKSDAEIDELPVLPLVIARCAPQTKVRMIEALHRRNKFVAMTGDGVNDSPSLKRADVGIAMGQNGSDVAKDAADIVLTDDNFASILNAIEEGRRMFDNIKKFVLHLLAQNVAQACTLLIGLAFKDASKLSVFPLAPVEILWIIMVTSGLPAMGLGMERAVPDILERPPHNIKTGVFTWEVCLDMLAYGLWTAALCLSSFVLVVYGWGNGELGINCNSEYSESCHTVFTARATCFTALTWFSLFLAWEMIDLRRSFFRMTPDSKHYFTQWFRDVWKNQFLFWTVIAGFITIFPLLYIPVINDIVFKHIGISWQWGIVFVCAFLFFVGVESWKWGKRVYYRRRGDHAYNPEEDITERMFSRYASTIGSRDFNKDDGVV